MRLGTLLLPTRPWAQLAADVRRAEEIGYDVVYVADHLTHPTMPGRWIGEAFTTLAAAAMTAPGVELGVLVASAAFRNPVPLARAAATLADISGGRLVLGLGAGIGADAAADRGEPASVALGRRFRDVLEGYGAVLRGEAGWQGQDLGWHGVETLPLPPDGPRPFLMVAAHGPRGLELVARHADGWSTYGRAGEPEELWRALREQSGALDRSLDAAGRDPGSLRRSVLLGLGSERPVDSVDHYLTAVHRAADLGFDEVVVYWPDGNPGDHLWSDLDVHADAVRSLREAGS